MREANHEIDDGGINQAIFKIGAVWIELGQIIIKLHMKRSLVMHWMGIFGLHKEHAASVHNLFYKVKKETQGMAQKA
jgi:hypothetical protein